MNPKNSIKAVELLQLGSQLNEKINQIKSCEKDDDYDMGIKKGKRLALQEIQDLILDRLSVLLGEVKYFNPRSQYRERPQYIVFL